MHHDIGLKVGQGARDGAAIANVGAAKGVAHILGDRREGVEIPRIGQLIVNEKMISRL
jgi:hypothetical protein